MASSKVRFGFQLAFALATASTAAAALETDQRADAEFMRRVAAAAAAACPRGDSADRVYRWNIPHRWDMNDTSCAANETDGGLEPPQGALAAVRTNGNPYDASESRLGAGPY